MLLYLEERYKAVDEKITNFDLFPEEIKVVVDQNIWVCFLRTGIGHELCDFFKRFGWLL